MVMMSESRRGTTISLIIVHSNEGDHKPGLTDDRTAENLAGYLQRECAAGRGKSYHKVVDNDSTVTLVPDDRAAWSAKGANRRSLNICLIGWARWTRDKWLQHPQMLARAAAEVSTWCARHRIPPVRLTPAQVRMGARGIIGHVDWSNSNLDDSDHTDPGVEFPWDLLLGKIAVPGTPLSKRGRPVSVELPSTLPAGEGRPGPGWPAVERTVATKSSVWVQFGFRGAWIQEAWWGERGLTIIDKGKPIFVEQFRVQRWKAPDWAEFVTIRYAAPSGGSVGIT